MSPLGRVVAAVLIGLALSPSLLAADLARGADVYKLWCDDCHSSAPGRFGAIPAGYNVLRRRYQGTSVPPVLTDRTDLSAVYIKWIVRHGQNVMPRTRKTEISDAELDDLTAWLTRNNTNTK